MAYFQQMSNDDDDDDDDDDDLVISDHHTLVDESIPILLDMVEPPLKMPCNTEEEEEDGGYDYEFIKPGPSEECICAICHLVARNAHQSSCCGKIFCEVCINKLKKSRYHINCPMCRQNFRCFKDIRTNREIQSLKIYCTNHNDGCLWEDVLQKVEEHIKTCPYQIIECERKCKKKVPRRLMKTHLANECPNRNVICFQCKEIGTWVFITKKHLDVCPDLFLPCSNAGCGEKVKRRNLNAHQEICPKRVVPCPYVKVGCTLTFKNEDIAKHKQEHVENHLSLAVDKIERLEIQQQTAPLVLKIERFDGSTPVRSQPFYTSKGGYKMSLLVKPNGFQEYGETWVSCSIDLMPGEYDDILEWPFRGEVTVELLNQLGDYDHREHTVNYPETFYDEPLLEDLCTQSQEYCYEEDEKYEYEEKVEENHYQPTQQHACESKKTNEREYGKIGEISNLISYDDDLGQFLPKSISLTQEKAIPINIMRPTPTKRKKTKSTGRTYGPPIVTSILRDLPTSTSQTHSIGNWTSSEQIEPQAQFLVNGTLYLRVNVRAHSQTKTWLY